MRIPLTLFLPDRLIIDFDMIGGSFHYEEYFQNLDNRVLDTTLTLVKSQFPDAIIEKVDKGFSLDMPANNLGKALSFAIAELAMQLSKENPAMLAELLARLSEELGSQPFLPAPIQGFSPARYTGKAQVPSFLDGTL